MVEWDRGSKRLVASGPPPSAHHIGHHDDDDDDDQQDDAHCNGQAVAGHVCRAGVGWNTRGHRHIR